MIQREFILNSVLGISLILNLGRFAFLSDMLIGKLLLEGLRDVQKICLVSFEFIKFLSINDILLEENRFWGMCYSHPQIYPLTA